ncbi:MAG: molecular chaperone TorD family protein [Bacteroidales bacterium]|jgi:TorA maturation chaperone TorD|nr:molecular chaperone TorD family protein [Bacteroidales bacterium]
MEISLDNNKKNLLKGYNMLIYFAGSMIMNEPVEECVVDFWQKGILKTLPVNSTNPRFIEAASQLRKSCTDKSTCLSILQEDFRKLFSDSSGSPLAPPYKSVYTDAILEAAEGKEKVTDFYNSYGWKKRSNYKADDDNLGIELLFVTLLIDKYISFEDEACRIEMAREIRRFISTHIMTWLPAWYERMQETAGSMSYKGIATLIYASVEDIYDLMGKPESGFRKELRN